MPARSRLRVVVVIVVAAAGVGCLFGALTMGWWTIHTDWNPWTIAGHEYHFVATATFLPGPNARTQCWVNNTSMPGWGPICAAVGAQGFLTPYNDPLSGSAAVASLYSNLFLSVLVAAVAGSAATVWGGIAWLLPGTPGRSHPRLPSGVLCAVALLVFATCVGFAVAEPGVYSSGHASSGVDSFWGSCSSTADPQYCGVNTTETWAPGVGWYVALLGGGLLVVAGVLSWRSFPAGLAGAGDPPQPLAAPETAIDRSASRPPPAPGGDG